MSKIFISCNEASILSTREQYEDLNTKEIFTRKLHNSYCKKCRSFHKNNDHFQRNIKNLNWVSMTNSQKAIIKKRIIEAIKNK